MEIQFNNIYMKRFYYFNLYVIKGKNGDILIDTGFICMKKRVKKWLDKFNIKLIILTHVHVDHSWNVKYIKDLYNCKVAIGTQDKNNIDNSKIKTFPKNKHFNTWTKLMNFGMNKFIPEEYQVDYYLKNNEVINKYGLNLKIISLKGHTTGSIGIKYKDYLFVGDALVNRGPKVSIAFQNQHPEHAIKSVNKILKENPSIVFVGHDKEITKDKLFKSFTSIDKA
ncbi:MAG: MBL fold metallo-hydrolase [Firmicutes bacterium]|nr:MBL fold metallo-hydrolase [Bacillota bacterium]